jgi:hypothetical protein
VQEPLDQALHTSLSRMPAWHRHIPLGGRL